MWCEERRRDVGIACIARFRVSRLANAERTETTHLPPVNLSDTWSPDNVNSKDAIGQEHSKDAIGQRTPPSQPAGSGNNKRRMLQSKPPDDLIAGWRTLTI